MITKKHGKESESPGGEKKSTAESEVKAGGTDDWRTQQDPKPNPPQPVPIPPAGPAPAPKQAQMMDSPMTRATPPGTAGTPITVTPYTVLGVVRLYQVGTVVVGSEQAAAESLKNQLFRPPIAS